jgi:hypothetical protein
MRTLAQGLLAAAVAVLVLCLSGCSWLDSACTQTLPARTSATILVDDAQTALSEASTVIARVANSEVRAKALQALAVAQAALRAAQASLGAVDAACSTPDIPKIFAEFAAAWKALAPFLALLGGPSAGSQVAAPAVVGMCR